VGTATPEARDQAATPARAEPNAVDHSGLLPDEALEAHDQGMIAWEALKAAGRGISRAYHWYGRIMADDTMDRAQAEANKSSRFGGDGGGAGPGGAVG
jgi:hypothetical protein